VTDIQGYDPSEDWINSIALKSAISTLSKEEQEILLLRYANEVPISTICKVMGISRFAIYRKLTKILKYLNSKLVKGGFANE
jgi:RNA polymerase sigma-70 factor (ECF subfamily)